MKYLAKLQRYSKEERLTERQTQILHDFYQSYLQAIELNGLKIENYDALLSKYLELVIRQLEHPFFFEAFHKGIRKPFDYYAMGLELFRPLILFETSNIHGRQYLDQMEAQLKQKENVVFFANHQTEPDPQAISLLLEKTHPRFAEEMIFVAGHRVITDPLAVPLSKGRNLLCIFSKKHIETDPEKKEEKLLHNQRTMRKLIQLLAEGGRCIYVAPSGGRDRPNAEGKLEIAPFDPQSIEMFSLLSQQAKTPTHFYPLTLDTYDLLPPPDSIEKEIGEQRHTKCTPIQLAFNHEIDMENFPGSEELDKKSKRQARADYIWGIVNQDYHDMVSG